MQRDYGGCQLMNINALLNSLFREISNEIHTNSGFRERIVQTIDKHIGAADKKKVQSHRRKPGPFDPMLLYRAQPETLKSRLEGVSIDELKDIIAEHSMDRIKLAMKWKSKDRLIDLIITTVHSRSQKGDVFRTNMTTQNSESVQQNNQPDRE